MGSVIGNLRVEGVTKLFGPVRALAGVSLEIGPGEAVAVMGPNGAGKSTLLSILSLTMVPSRGRLLYNGAPAKLTDGALVSKIGLLSHQPLLYPDLTARQNLLLFGRLYGVSDLTGAVEAVESEMDLGRFGLDRPVRVLSRGQLQRVALARALVADPDLLLLDEPAAGLDSGSVERIARALGRRKERGGMAVIVTHDPAVAAGVASRAVLLKDGRIALDAPAPSDAEGFRSLYNGVMGGGGG